MGTTTLTTFAEFEALPDIEGKRLKARRTQAAAAAE